MIGLLLINLGTPDAPTPRAVRRYLRQFLSDPRVIDINPVGRFLLLNLIILPFRPAKSAAAYRQIWTDRGSPLLFHGRDLVARVQEQLGDQWRVELGMRYGSPSIASAIDQLLTEGVDRIVLLPLFPQSASSSGGSALQEALGYLGKQWNVPPISSVDVFYRDPGFIHAFASVGRPVLNSFSPEHILFSFHGLPERHMRRSNESRGHKLHCLQQSTCCDKITESNRDCYRAQCFATAAALAETLNLSEEQWTICFQSRLGRTPWIKPYTDHAIDQLAQSGVKKVAVFCPAFVADCLETLEEIGIRARQQFIAAGGEELILVPSLNSTPAWVDAVIKLAKTSIEVDPVQQDQRNAS